MGYAGEEPVPPWCGLPPLFLAGREGESRRFRAALRSAPEIPANFTLTGLRGVGMTALLTQLRGPSESTQDLARQLFDTVIAANKAGYMGLALLLDEAQVIRDDRTGADFPLSTLLAAVAALQRELVPVSLTLCGLPPLKTNLLEARTYAERMFRGEEVGSLSVDDARAAFVVPLSDTLVTFDEDLVERVVDEVDGYPYFIQLWGAELWDAADIAALQHFDVALLDAVEPGIYRRLDRDFYEPRLGLSPPPNRVSSLRWRLPRVSRAPHPQSRGTATIQLNRGGSSGVERWRPTGARALVSGRGLLRARSAGSRRR